MAKQEVQIPIQGMTCAACANRIEKGLQRMDGVDEVNVNFAVEKANVTYDPEQLDVQAFEDKIEKLGYHVQHESITFDISGMTCAACATRIEKKLSKTDGVSKANVNFALENVTVEYNEGTINKQAD